MRWTLTAVALLLIMLTGSTASDAPAKGRFTLVPLGDSAGAPAGPTWSPSVSDDGRFVAMLTDASTLVSNLTYREPPPAPGFIEYEPGALRRPAVVVLDRATGRMNVASRLPDGAVEAEVSRPSIARDGSVVVYEREVGFPDEGPDGRHGVVVQTLDDGKPTVQRLLPGAACPCSAAGNIVAYQVSPTGDWRTREIWLVDLATNVTTNASGDVGETWYSTASGPSLDHDGHGLAFITRNNTAVKTTGAGFRVISLNATGEPSKAYEIVQDASGHAFAYTDFNAAHSFTYDDRKPGRTSLDPRPQTANTSLVLGTLAVSPDARFVLFETATDWNNRHDIFAMDIATKQIAEIVHWAGECSKNFPHYVPRMAPGADAHGHAYIVASECALTGNGTTVPHVYETNLPDWFASTSGVDGTPSPTRHSSFAEAASLVAAIVMLAGVYRSRKT